MARRLLLWLSCVALLTLAGCGFGLRQNPDFPFSSLYSNLPPLSPLGIELKRVLRSSPNLIYIDEPGRLNEAQVILDVYGEQRTKTVLGLNAKGQVREFQLRLNLKFRLRTPLGKELIPETELVQQRTLSFDEAFALAKEGEEALLYRNMQSDMVQQILRRLAAVNAALMS